MARFDLMLLLMLPALLQANPLQSKHYIARDNEIDMLVQALEHMYTEQPGDPSIQVI